MRIFVTGANGFIGQAFCKIAIARNHEVLGLCRNADTELPLGCKVVCGSLENIPWKEIVSFGPDVALHTAWIATPGVYLTSPENESLIKKSITLFHGLSERGVKHLAGTGTCIEYAASSDMLREDKAPLAPAFPYSQAKAALFEHLRELAAINDLDWTWFRVFYPYGPGEHPLRLPSQIIRQLSKREPITLRTPRSIKDYIYISDLAEALCIGLEAGIIGPVNLGSGIGTSVLQIAMMIANLLEVNPVLIQEAENPDRDPYPVMISDVSLIQSSGWKSNVSLELGLKKLISSIA